MQYITIDILSDYDKPFSDKTGCLVFGSIGIPWLCSPDPNYKT